MAEERQTESGIELKPVYTAADVPGELELPGEYPFTRGPYPTMYRGRPWTIRQYAGFGSAEETNARFRYLLERGQTGLSTAFDLPTQLGYDSDDPRALGEVGRTGVAIDSVADMEILFAGIPLGEVSTSMTINAPASLLLLLYELVGEGQGVPGDRLRGTVQNDILKEYVARGNYIFPPRPSMRLTTDLFAYCTERLPSFNTISISGYHIREAGSTAVQEIAFTLANGLAYARAATDAGLSPDDFGERLSFFFNAHNDFFQEVAKFRAARRLWANLLRERLGVTNEKALALRFHAQTGGSTLTAQQPENNIVRVAVQALSAVCGGAQSLHANGFDEALALPTEHAARIALRTQQILRDEAGTTGTADPLGGAYFLEALTDGARAARARADRPGRRARRGGRRDRGRLRAARDRGGVLPVHRRSRERRAGRRRRERVPGRRAGADRDSTGSTPRSSGDSSSAPPGSARSATPRRPRRPSPRCAASPAPTRTSCRRCATHCVRAAPSVRSARRSARSGACTTPNEAKVTRGHERRGDRGSGTAGG